MIVQALGRTIESLKARGMTLVLGEQNSGLSIWPIVIM